MLAEGRHIHIGIKAHGHTEQAVDGACEVRLCPPRLGRRGHISKAWRPGIRIDGAKGGDAHGSHRTQICVPIEKRLHLGQRLFWAGGVEPGLCAYIIRAGPDSADKLGAPSLNASKKWHWSIPPHQPGPACLGRSDSARTPGAADEYDASWLPRARPLHPRIPAGDDALATGPNRPAGSARSARS